MAMAIRLGRSDSPFPAHGYDLPVKIESWNA